MELHFKHAELFIIIEFHEFFSCILESNFVNYYCYTMQSQLTQCHAIFMQLVSPSHKRRYDRPFNLDKR